MKGTYAVLLSIAIISLMMVPSASAEGDIGVIECGNVTVMTFGENVNVDTRDMSTFNVNVHNGSSSYASIRFTQTDDTPIRLEIGKDLVIKGNDTQAVSVRIIPDNFSKEGEYDVKLNVKVMQDDQEYEGTLDIIIILASAYATSEYYNTFMGLFVLPEPLDEEIISVTLTIVGWFVMAIILAFIFARIIRFVFKTEGQEEKETERVSFASAFLCVLAIGVQNTVRVMGLNEMIIAGVDNAMVFVLLIIGAFICWGMYKTIVHRLCMKIDPLTKFNEISLIPFLNLVGKVLIVGAVATNILSMMGMSFAGILTGAGIAGLGVSMGVKPFINEFFSGITVLLTRPFRKGDRVRINSEGALAVQKVDVLKTEFVTFYSNDTITMPNSTIASANITNITREGMEWRYTVRFRVAYGCDLELVKKLITDAAREHPGIVSGDTTGTMHDPVVIVSNTNDHGALVLTLAFYSKMYGDTWDFTGELYESVLKKFRANGIRIPYYKTKANIFGGDSVAN